jgi:hypothetical protein
MDYITGASNIKTESPKNRQQDSLNYPAACFFIIRSIPFKEFSEGTIFMP